MARLLSPAVHRAVAPPPPVAPLPAVDGHRSPWPGREVRAGDTVLHVRETPGPADATAVYVHGLAGSATNWTDLAGLLACRAAGVAVDLPGFGRSHPPAEPSGYRPAALAAAVRDLVAGRAARGPVHLVGNSLGGVVALHVAAARPDLVRTLTLISPAVPDLRPDPRRLSDPRMALAMLPGPLGGRARAALAAVSARERAERVVAVCFGDPARAPEHRLAEAAAEFAERAELDWAARAVDAAARALLRSWTRPRAFWALARRVRAPTLVVWGGRDRLVAPRHAARTAAAVPDARLLVLPGAGHVAQIEEPAAVADAIAGMWDAVAHGTWARPDTGGKMPP